MIRRTSNSTRLWLLFGLCLIAQCAGAGVVQVAGPSVPPADVRAAVLETVNRYADAWYEGNPDAMQPVLHPDFEWIGIRVSKREPSQWTHRSGLAQLEAVDRGLGRNADPSKRKKDIAILEVTPELASARIAFDNRSELLQLALWNNAWVIVHALSADGARP